MSVTNTSAENQDPGKGEAPLQQVLRLIHQGLLESAKALVDRHDIALDAPALTGLIEDCLQRVEAFQIDGDIRSGIRYQRRAAALAMLRDTGHLSGTVIPPVELPEGYCGKIMLLFMQGDCIAARTCLRSGDDWHREILRSFKDEVRDYGFETFQISPRGGAFAEFPPDGSIVLFGASEEFGRCPREDAIQLIQAAFPDKRVHWSDAAGM